jgi:peptidoglycan/LPS O-acetylase OafA/YrhL
MNPTRPPSAEHLDVLDGWRGISILLVLAAHLLPLGPKALKLNDMVAPMGMALFFTLSGFLITRFLLEHDSVIDFLIRRFFRIVPLALIGMAVALTIAGAPREDYLPHFLFYANLPPGHLTDPGSHLWSLCVEVQFYAGIALLVATVGRRGLYLLPLVCLAVTLHRIATGTPIDIVTWRRIDEILAGATLAMVFGVRFGDAAKRGLGLPNAYVLLALLAVSSHPSSGFMNYLRPYIAALLVGVTLVNPPPWLGALLKTRTLVYIATISYALYVIHHLFMYTWLGSGERLEKYLKRPLLLLATFALAHISTFHFEQRWIAFGKHLSTRLKAGRTARVE